MIQEKAIRAVMNGPEDITIFFDDGSKSQMLGENTIVIMLLNQCKVPIEKAY